MSYTVGLDFGTHQTKVCIENATNPAQKLYEFLEFIDENGKRSVLFPSIVQINDDDTVSYGFVNPVKCKANIEKPIKKNLPELELKDLVPKPIEPLYKTTTDEIINLEKLYVENRQKDIKRKLNKKKNLLGRDNYRFKKKYSKSLSEWNKVNIENQRIKELYNKQSEQIESEYKTKLSKWHGNPLSREVYRYFKLATFSNTIKWEHKIPTEMISTWYLAYVIFLLKEKLSRLISASSKNWR